MEDRYYKELEIPAGNHESIKSLNRNIADLIEKQYSGKDEFEISFTEKSSERTIGISNGQYIIELICSWGPNKRYIDNQLKEFYAYSITAETEIPLLTIYDKRNSNLMIYSQFAGVAILISLYALLVMLTGVVMFSTYLVFGVIFGGFALGKAGGKLIRSLSNKRVLRKVEQSIKISEAFDEWNSLKENLGTVGG